MSEKLLNCSCGKNIGKVEGQPFPKTDNCPICKEHFNEKARDMWGTSCCQNNHVWHTCLECKEVVIGESPKFIYTEKKEVVDYKKELLKALLLLKTTSYDKDSEIDSFLKQHENLFQKNKII
jgi:hypothetical protein